MPLDDVTEEMIVEQEYEMAIVANALYAMSPCTVEELFNYLYERLPYELFSRCFLGYDKIEFVVLFKIFNVLTIDNGFISITNSAMDIVGNSYEYFDEKQMELLHQLLGENNGEKG